MALNTTPLINGRAYDWSQISVLVLGNIAMGIKAISYKTKQNKTNNYGAGVQPVSRGYGMVEYEGSITIDGTELRRIQEALPVGQTLMDIPPFPITVAYLNGNKTVTDKLFNVEFMEQGTDMKQGDTDQDFVLPLLIAGISWGK